MKTVLFVLVLASAAALAEVPDWVRERRFGAGAEVVRTFEARAGGGSYTALMNWSKGFMEFEATATADLANTNNPGQAEDLARGAACELAYAEAARFLGGYDVQARRALKLSQLSVEETATHWQGYVRNAVKLADTCAWESREGIRYPRGRCKIGLLLYGGAPTESFAIQALQSVLANLKEAGYVTVAAAGAEGAAVTGVILDLRGSAFAPTLSPVVLVQSETRQLVFPTQTVDHKFAMQTGIAGYLKNEDEARTDSRLQVNGVSNPLIIKPVNVEDNLIYVSPDDAARMTGFNIKYGILDQCRVIILVG